MIRKYLAAARLTLLLALAPLMLAGISSTAEAAFPTINNTRQSIDAGPGTDHLIVLNATITAGDLLVIVAACDTDDAITWDNSTAGTWTNLWDTANSTLVRVVGYAIVADGTEDGKTLTVTTPSTEKLVAISIRILDAEWEGTLVGGVANGTSATGTSTTPDPPSVTPQGGSEDNLILAVAGLDDGTGAVSAYSLPDNQESIIEGTAGGTRLAISSDELTASPNNPGTYTFANGAAWVAQTIAVSPAAAGGNTSLRRRRSN